MLSNTLDTPLHISFLLTMLFTPALWCLPVRVPPMNQISAGNSSPIDLPDDRRKGDGRALRFTLKTPIARLALIIGLGRQGVRPDDLDLISRSGRKRRTARDAQITV